MIYIIQVDSCTLNFFYALTLSHVLTVTCKDKSDSSINAHNIIVNGAQVSCTPRFAIHFVLPRNGMFVFVSFYLFFFFEEH